MVREALFEGHNFTCACRVRGEIVCCGSRTNEAGNVEAFAIKLNKELKVVVDKVIEPSDYKIRAVTADRRGNVIIAGDVMTPDGESNAVVTKMNNKLNIIKDKICVHKRHHFVDVVTDKHNNIICVGWSQSHTLGSSLIVKFNSDLFITAQKEFNHMSENQFDTVVVDHSGNIVCAGFTYESDDMCNAVIVRFDAFLNNMEASHYDEDTLGIINAVTLGDDGTYTGIGTVYPSNTNSRIDAVIVRLGVMLEIVDQTSILDSEFYDTSATNDLGEVICAGYTYVNGVQRPCIMFLDRNLTLVNLKYKENHEGYVCSVIVDLHDNIICVGNLCNETIGYVVLLTEYDKAIDGWTTISEDVDGAT